MTFGTSDRRLLGVISDSDKPDAQIASACQMPWEAMSFLIGRDDARIKEYFICPTLRSQPNLYAEASPVSLLSSSVQQTLCLLTMALSCLVAR